MAFRRHASLALIAVLAGPAAAAELGRIAVRGGTAPGVALELTGDVEPVAHQIPAGGGAPARVYLDFRDTRLAPGAARAADGAGVVRKVRAAQFDPSTARVVIELGSPAPFDLVRDGRTLTVTFAAAHAAKPTPPVLAVARVTEAPPATESVPEPSPLPERVPAPPAVSPPAPAPVVRRDEALRASPPPSRPLDLEERIARRYANEDWAGIVALYAANTDVVRRDVDAPTRAAVVDALRILGLEYSARKLAGPATPNEAPALRVARAELELAAGDVAGAEAGAAGLDEGAVDPSLVPALRRLRIRFALARGELDTAAAAIGNRAAPELRAELASAALHAGRTAAERHTCGKAVAAYQQALDADGGRTARAAAAAGLVQSALACSNPEATMAGLGVLAESSHPLLRRAASLLAATQAGERRSR